MTTRESTINDALAEALRGTRRAWRGSDVVRSENSGTLKGSSGRPDILVNEPNVSPVANVEAKAVSHCSAQSSAASLRYAERSRSSFDPHPFEG